MWPWTKVPTEDHCETPKGPLSFRVACQVLTLARHQTSKEEAVATVETALSEMPVLAPLPAQQVQPRHPAICVGGPPPVATPVGGTEVLPA